MLQLSHLSELGVLHLHIALFIQLGKETIHFMLPSGHEGSVSFYLSIIYLS